MGIAFDDDHVDIILLEEIDNAPSASVVLEAVWTVWSCVGISDDSISLLLSLLRTRAVVAKPFPRFVFLSVIVDWGVNRDQLCRRIFPPCKD